MEGIRKFFCKRKKYLSEISWYNSVDSMDFWKVASISRYYFQDVTKSGILHRVQKDRKETEE